MDAGVSTVRESRSEHRHELRTLTYLTADLTNGGVVRNINQKGVGVQMVIALIPGQRVRLRFDLRNPRLRVETLAEVVWSTFSGQCGIRFLDLPHAISGQINQWIMGDMLESIALHADQAGSSPSGELFSMAYPRGSSEKNPISPEQGGLLISPTPAKVIPLPVRREAVQFHKTDAALLIEDPGTLDWLSQPLSPRSIAWLIDILTVLASSLLFGLVFLAMTREVPRWPVAVAAAGAVLMALTYWGFFWAFGGASLGKQLARKIGLDSLPEENSQKRA